MRNSFRVQDWERWRRALLILALLLASGLVGLWPSVYLLLPLIGACGLILLLRQPALGLVAMAALSFTLPF